MPNIELLNSTGHKDVKIIASKMISPDADNFSTIIFPNEIESAQREFPVLFRKHPETGEFYTSVLMGLEHNENLFVDDNQWRANFMPAVIARGPFLIGFQEQTDKDNLQKTPVIYIDMDHQAVSHREGEAVFEENEEPSRFIQNVNRILLDIHHGVENDKAMIAAFQQFDLIEPLSCDIELVNGQTLSLNGIYAINNEKLNQLSGEQCDALNQKGFLRYAFLIASSLNNIQQIIARKNTLLQNTEK